MTVNREEIARTADVVDWLCLRAHLERGGLILIDETLDLTDVACKIADNDSKSIENYINAGKISKPSQEQIKLWDAQPSKIFRIIIISPYVILQEQVDSL